MQLADALRHGAFGGVTAAGFEPEALRPPGYPAFLAAVLYGLRLPLSVAMALQLAIYAACVAATLRLLRPIRWAPEIAMLLTLGYVFPAIYACGIVAEAFAMATITCVALLAISDELTAKRLVAIGALSALGAYFRPDMILLPLAAAIALLLTRPFSPRLFLPLVAAAIVLAPFTLYNYVSFGRVTPMPVASAMGNSLYMSTWQHKLSQDDLNAFYRKQVTPEAVRSGLAAEVAALNRKLGADPRTAPWHPKEYMTRSAQITSSKVFAAAARKRILADPGAYASHVIGNVWKLWNTSVYPTSTPVAARGALQLVSGLLTVLGLAGCALTLLQPKGWPLPRVLALVFAYVPALHIWFHGEARYTSAVRPLLVAFAATLIAVALRRWTERTRSGQAASAHRQEHPELQS